MLESCSTYICVIYSIQLVNTDFLDRIVLTDVTIPVMVVTTSMVLVILGVNPVGRDMSVRMVMKIFYISYVLIIGR